MELMEIIASAFKPQCLRLVDQVSQTGEEIAIL